MEFRSLSTVLENRRLRIPARRSAWLESTEQDDFLEAASKHHVLLLPTGTFHRMIWHFDNCLDSGAPLLMKTLATKVSSDMSDNLENHKGAACT